ncbi:MAG: phosphate-starvation-inducible PsiE family protein [Alkalinema sp. CAN_BIN05]|nr:phosphate-starvation-inducible PsiE family protein [Alkalinema sp. CAN_BIN05]
MSHLTSDHSWHEGLKWVEKIAAKILSIGLVIVIFMALFDLSRVLLQDIILLRVTVLGKSLFNLFGLFLNVLIALELLENIGGYLQKNVIQVELVIITAMIAIARKIIILDFEKISSEELIALALSMLTLGASYWVVRKSGPNGSDS